jgi:hypothetical protein
MDGQLVSNKHLLMALNSLVETFEVEWVLGSCEGESML